jgi:hypothetical protein
LLPPSSASAVLRQHSSPGDADGAPRPDPSSYAKKFTGKYSHGLIKDGIGHNLPQEAPQAFAEAVGDVDRMMSGNHP